SSSTEPSPTEIYTLSLHDALPISRGLRRKRPTADLLVHNTVNFRRCVVTLPGSSIAATFRFADDPTGAGQTLPRRPSEKTDCARSEEHTSELQSPYDLVCRLLLEK